MGVDTSTPALALEIARLGGIAHLSDAMLPTVIDRHTGSTFMQEKLARCQTMTLAESAMTSFDPKGMYDLTYGFIRDVMQRKRGDGGIFVNIMEKLAMGNPRETMYVRMASAMDAGIDGITLGAGLHLGSLELIRDHPRFRDVKIGIIVSSARALKLFMHRAVKVSRLPDYIIVEGPLAGGHLGFPLNWQDYDLNAIVADVQHLLEQEQLHIPVIPAGGIFTGGDAVGFLQRGAAAVQVATRFTVTRESGLPMEVKQAFFNAEAADVEVNLISPTGYPMRMLKSSPAIGSKVKPMCEAYGYGLDRAGVCPYQAVYEQSKQPDAIETPASAQICLCVMMLGYKVWTCGHTVSRLKETSQRLPDGSYRLLTAEEVFTDYQHSTNEEIRVPAPRVLVSGSQMLLV